MTSNVPLPTDVPSSEIDKTIFVDALLHRQIISFGALPPASFPDLFAEKISVAEQRIQARIGEEGERLQPLIDYRKALDALHDSAVAMQALLTADTLQVHEQSARLTELREQSLLAEARLQVFEGSLSRADLTLIEQTIAALNPLEGSIRAAELCIALDSTAHALDGVLIFTRQPALDRPELEEPALLYMPGQGGGLQKFASLHAMMQEVEFTLLSGLDTPFWRHVPASLRDAIMSSAKAASLKLVARTTMAPALTHSVHAHLTSLQESHRLNANGQRFFADATDQEQTAAHLHIEACDSLSVHVNEARDHAIDRIAELQRTASLVEQLPLWLLQSSNEVRHEYAAQLKQYHASATLLESHIDRVLPSLEAFTRRTLGARIKEDLNVDINADKIFIDLPESARQEAYPPQGQGLTADRVLRWKVSETRTRVSLAELARDNIDPDDQQMRARLESARIDLPEGHPIIKAGLTVKYVVSGIISLDIAEQYRTLLQQVFETNPVRSPLLAQDILLKPYELEILLDGFAAMQRKLISTQAYNILQAAVYARSNDDLRAAQLSISWVVLNSGHSVSGDTRSTTLPGMCVIDHEPTGVSLIYLPRAIDGVSLIEGSRAVSAKQRLINRLNANPALIDYLVSLIPQNSRRAEDKRYIEEALKHKFDSFMVFTPGLFLQIVEQQVQARAWLAFEEIRQQARSSADIHHGHLLRNNQLYMGFFKALLSFLPGLGTLISVYDGWNDGHAAAAAFKQGAPGEGALLIGSAALSVLDVILSVVPGVASLAAIRKVARHATKSRQVTGIADALPSVTRKRYALQPFKGYDADVSLVDAIKQKGPNDGTFLKNGELWITQKNKVYAVYRRQGEQTLRLKKTSNKGYEPPVRRDPQGNWVYHTDVGLKGGMKSSIAEVLMTRAYPDRSFTQQHARELLDQFAFPSAQQYKMELAVAQHFKQHRKVPAWTQQFRRKTPAPTVYRTPAVEPGPAVASGGKPRQPSSARGETGHRSSEPIAGPSRATNPSAVPAPNAWRSWGRRFNNLEKIQDQPPIYRLPGGGERAIKIDDDYFVILPDGADVRKTTVLLRNPTVSADAESLLTLNDVIRRNPYDQPLITSFKNNAWIEPHVLFKQDIPTLIHKHRPGFTGYSERVLAMKIYELADASSQGFTATRLINMKATLNAWRKGEVTPFPTRRFDDPLNMLEGAPLRLRENKITINLRAESSARDFHSLNFLPANAADTLQLTSPMTKPELADFMIRQLNNGGYHLVSGGKLIEGRSTVLVFERPGLNCLYMMAVRQFSHAKITHVFRANEPIFPMSNRWLDRFRRRHTGQPITQRVDTARAEGTFVRLIGGVHSRKATSRKKVFVVRIADDM